jgi:hypothetical protein
MIEDRRTTFPLVGATQGHGEPHGSSHRTLFVTTVSSLLTHSPMLTFHLHFFTLKQTFDIANLSDQPAEALGAVLMIARKMYVEASHSIRGVPGKQEVAITPGHGSESSVKQLPG